MSKLENYKKLVAEVQQKKEELAKELAGNLPQLFEKQFAECPELESFSWNQYTPYFADGDTPVFGANLCDPSKVNGRCRWDDEEEFSDKVLDAAQECLDILEELGEDILEEMFGDHVEFTVS